MLLLTMTFRQNVHCTALRLKKNYTSAQVPAEIVMSQVYVTDAQTEMLRKHNCKMTAFIE